MLTRSGFSVKLSTPAFRLRFFFIAPSTCQDWLEWMSTHFCAIYFNLRCIYTGLIPRGHGCIASLLACLICIRRVHNKILYHQHRHCSDREILKAECVNRRLNAFLVFFGPRRGSPVFTIVSPSWEKHYENGDSSTALWNHNSNAVSSTPLSAAGTAAPTLTSYSVYMMQPFCSLFIL